MIHSVAPFKKDVTAKLYGGDVTRKVRFFPVPRSDQLLTNYTFTTGSDEASGETKDW